MHVERHEYLIDADCKMKWVHDEAQVHSRAHIFANNQSIARTSLYTFACFREKGAH
jgi:hypothetical protein